MKVIWSLNKRIGLTTPGLQTHFYDSWPKHFDQLHGWNGNTPLQKDLVYPGSLRLYPEAKFRNSDPSRTDTLWRLHPWSKWAISKGRLMAGPWWASMLIFSIMERVVLCLKSSRILWKLGLEALELVDRKKRERERECIPRILHEFNRILLGNKEK